MLLSAHSIRFEMYAFHRRYVTAIVYYLVLGMLVLMFSDGHWDIRTILSTYRIESIAVYVHHTNGTLKKRTIGLRISS